MTLKFWKIKISILPLILVLRFSYYEVKKMNRKTGLRNKYLFFRYHKYTIPLKVSGREKKIIKKALYFCLPLSKYKKTYLFNSFDTGGGISLLFYFFEGKVLMDCQTWALENKIFFLSFSLFFFYIIFF